MARQGVTRVVSDMAEAVDNVETDLLGLKRQLGFASPGHSRAEISARRSLKAALEALRAAVGALDDLEATLVDMEEDA